MIFIVNNLETNGGTTFVLRFLRNWPIENGKKPQVLVLSRNPDCVLEKEFLAIANVYYLEDFIYAGLPKSLTKIYLFHGWLVDWKKFFKMVDETHFHSLSIFGVYFSLFASKKRSIKVSLGIYHINELVFKTNFTFVTNAVLDLLHSNRKIGIIFFNEFCERAYREKLNTSSHDYVLVPIGIEFGQLLPEASQKTTNKIVSIGNLNAFKTYNEHVIQAISVLSHKYDLNYHIYGAGENEEYLKNLAKSLGVFHLVHFGGQINYAEFAGIVRSAKIFVGSGTAVLEAAVQGVVSITGIDSCKQPISYGYVSDINGYDYNEFDEEKRAYSFEYLIERVLKSSQNEYDQLVKMGIDAASRFHVSNTIEGFLSLEGKMKPFSTHDVSRLKLLKATVVFLFLGVLDVLGLDRTFRFRRNQG